MIQNKNQFKNALKNGTIKEIKRIYNFDKNNKIPEGSTATIEHVQSNSIKLKWDCLDNPTWSYYDFLEIKNNKILYFDYVPEHRLAEAKEIIKNKGLDVELIPLEEKEKEKVNKGSNQIYTYKYVIIKNEIIEA